MQLFCTQPGRIEARERQCRAADDVHARKHVGVGVCGVDHPDQPDEEIVLRKFRRTQVLPVRKEHAEENRAAEAESDVDHETLERGRIGEKQIDRHQKQQRVPGAVGNDKEPAERNLIVDGKIGHPVLVDNQMLREPEQHQVDNPDQKIPDMRICLKKRPDRMSARGNCHSQRLPPSRFLRASE